MAKKLEGTDFKQDNSFETSAQTYPNEEISVSNYSIIYFWTKTLNFEKFKGAEIKNMTIVC